VCQAQKRKHLLFAIASFFYDFSSGLSDYSLSDLKPVSVLAHLIADDTADSSTTHRTQDATTGDDSACYPTKTCASDCAFLTAAHAIPGRAPGQSHGKNCDKACFTESRGIHKKTSCIGTTI